MASRIVHDVTAEMATVDALLASGATTRRTDALILAWVKMEKQLRRLFSYLVFQNPAFTKHDEEALVNVFVDHRGLYFHTFIKCLNDLGTVTVETLVGPQYTHYQEQIARIRVYRNKIMHGQITGQNLQSPQLEKDIQLLRDWIAALAVGAEEALGYDGIARNTFIKAKSVPAIAKITYPFTTVDRFRMWLDKHAR
jgi:hypothetical protein